MTLIILLVGVILYQIKIYVPESPGCAIPVPWCGTPNFTEKETKGKEIFNSNCAACHKKNARSTGPALAETDSLVFIKWLAKNKHKIDSTKVEEWGIDYHRLAFSRTLNKKEIANLIEYCKSK
ncbi:Cytochrome c [Flavobacterium aquidurense]|nr:Cytochrome c [Flavobacterium aquidurense]